MKDYIDKFTIISHARSGTHFLYETLAANFELRCRVKRPGISGADAFKFHAAFNQLSELEKFGAKNLSLDDFLKEHNAVYIIRDLRDTLVALWFYYRRALPGKDPIGKIISKKSFGQYLRGTSLATVRAFGLKGNEANILSLLDPVQYWLDFTSWSDHVHTIKFEDLKLNPTIVLDNFSANFNLKPKDKNYIFIKKLVGYFPRKGIIGDWKNVFNKKDEEYVFARAHNTMSKFGYV